MRGSVRRALPALPILLVAPPAVFAVVLGGGGGPGPRESADVTATGPGTGRARGREHRRDRGAAIELTAVATGERGRPALITGITFTALPQRAGRGGSLQHGIDIEALGDAQAGLAQLREALLQLRGRVVGLAHPRPSAVGPGIRPGAPPRHTE